MIPRPSRRGDRPRALDVSFGLEPDTDDSTTTTSTMSDASRKRDRGDAPGDADIRGTKRRNLDSVPKLPRKYEPRDYEIPETRDLLLIFEEPELDDGRKRTRTLSHFTFFDSKPDTNLHMVSLDALDKGADDDHCILGAGFVLPKYEYDIDEVDQEDGLDEEADRQYIRLSRVLRYFTNYLEWDSPFHVETEHAIYELDVSKPSKKYKSRFRDFWRVQTILRLVISSAMTDPNQEYLDFLKDYESVKVFGEPLTVGELWGAVPKLRETLETVRYGDNLRASQLILLLDSRNLPPVIFDPVNRIKDNKKEIPKYDFAIEFNGTGNIDLAVMRSRTQTQLTPRIARLALPLFRGTFQVVGPRPRKEQEEPKDELSMRLQKLLVRAPKRKLVQFRPDQRIGRSRWLKHILVDGVMYEVGDTVLLYPGAKGGTPPDPNDLPPTDNLEKHFWFAKIIHMNEEHETVHVQWFEHSSVTLLQELGHSQELFLVNQCDTQSLKHIVGKVQVHYIKPDQSLADLQHQDYFYRYMWDPDEGVFVDVDMNALAASAREPPGQNCPACEVHKKFQEDVGPQKIHLGVRSYGVDYHLDDCVRIKADDGPCHIGHIIDFIHGNGDEYDVVVRLFGRTDKIGCRPVASMKDERHLFYTHDEMTFNVADLIGICSVVVKEDMPELDAWLTLSPYRFYVKYRFPSLRVTSWDSRRRMRWTDLSICHICLKQDLKKFKGMKTFLEQKPPLRAFDPFSGIGVFGLAMEEVGCFKLTHAVEVSPSAADTLRKNSPGTKVYNQCSNPILKNAILTHEGKNPDTDLKSIEGKRLPSLPKPGDIDCLITGFPCQPHSTMNMFQSTDDAKSNLILTTLSLVDFLQPPYCIFENVRGFLQYNLRAHQDSKYTVKGGIQMGGLKFVAAALLDMGYQFRCGLLQAGHYGAPQTRVRFFLIAAKRGLELPLLPQPTHDIPITDSLEIKIPGGPCIDPINTLPGVAPHRYVSVHDAISDLPKFDWKHPKENLTRRQMEEKHIKECSKDEKWCGFQGPNVPYEHPPRTTFQKQCRLRPTKDIQQYTRTWEPKRVERVVEIPVNADADYRSLPRHLWEWQFANPGSATARQGFRAGYYGRVQLDKWFQTTVTNVDPMAKQSRVIHPYSKRTVTVRELARSQGIPDHIVFHARENRVTTMHRHIGNAVAWPVARAIAREFLETLYKQWEREHPVDELSDMAFSEAEDSPMEID